MIAGLLLAAGHSVRFGGNKLLATLGDRAVMQWSAEALRAAVDEVWAVVPGEADDVGGALLARLGAHLVPHPGREAGMGSSIAAGIATLPRTVSAVVIALADQPTLDPAVIRSLVERWRATGAPVVAPLYADGRGHPVLFDRCCRGELASLDGDAGARSVILAHAARVELVPARGVMPADVDTPEALAELAGGWVGPGWGQVPSP